MTRARPGVRPLRGAIRVPGDKSISHRALILGALAQGRTRIAGANAGADVAATRRCLVALGVDIHETPDGELEVEGCAGSLSEPTEVLDGGNSGTTVRLLTGVCAGIEGLSVLTGDASLRARPMLRVVEPLRAMGATIDGRSGGNRAPLAIRGAALGPLEWPLRVPSAQVKSALLLAGLRAGGVVTVFEDQPTRNHTEVMLATMGVAVTGPGVSLRGPQVPQGRALSIPGDLSSALYLVVLAALVPGSDLQIEGVGLNPTRTGALDVLARMGVGIERELEETGEGEPQGRLRVRPGDLRATEVMPGEVPGLIDEVPILAIAATQAEGTTIFRSVGELRVKESDRLTALHEELTKLGARTEVAGDALFVHGPTPLRAEAVDARGDHRMALSLAVAGLATGANVRVTGWSSTQTSFPEFIDLVRAAQGARR